MFDEDDDGADLAELSARLLVIAVSRAVRLSMLHRLENDAIATTVAGLREAVEQSLVDGGGAVIKVGGDGVFVNGALVRAIGEVAESVERLHGDFQRLGVGTLAFTAVPDAAGVRALLGAFQACTAGNAAPLFALAVPGVRSWPAGQSGGGRDDQRSRLIAAFADVIVNVEDLRVGRVKRLAGLRRALQRLADDVAGAEATVLGLIVALEDDVDGRAVRVAALVLLVALCGGRSKKDAVAWGLLAARAAPHADIDDVAAAGGQGLALTPALVALRLELLTARPPRGFAAIVAAAEVSVAAWLQNGTRGAALEALRSARGIRFDDDGDAVAITIAAS